MFNNMSRFLFVDDIGALALEISTWIGHPDKAWGWLILLWSRRKDMEGHCGNAVPDCIKGERKKHVYWTNRSA